MSKKSKKRLERVVDVTIGSAPNNKDASIESKSSDSFEEKSAKKKNKSNYLGMWFILFGVTVLLTVFVFVGLGGVKKPSSSPMSNLWALKSVSDNGFVGQTGLKRLADGLGEGDGVVTVVNWASQVTDPETVKDLPFEQRMNFALARTYVEVVDDDGWIFIDGDYGILLIVPYTETLVSGKDDEELTLWVADLFEDAPVLRPNTIDAASARAVVSSGDALGEILKAAVECDDSTLELKENDLTRSWGVTSGYAPSISALERWGADNGRDVSKWTCYLTGTGPASMSGASVFYYIVQLDEASPSITAVNEEGELVGATKDMLLFNLYGVFGVAGGTHLPESFKTATYDRTTGAWRNDVTSEEWTELLGTLEQIYGETLQRAGILETNDGTETIENN